jgi:predicted DNA-binding transcriptional regulator YafY
MPEDKTAIRILSLVSLLSRDTYWPIDRLANRFGTTSRTIYRYLNDLEQMNYTLVKDDRNRYKIGSGVMPALLPEFDPDEYIFLRETVASIQAEHPLRGAILEKINANLQLPVLGALVTQQLTANMLHTIQEAMEEGVCVRLKDYYSLRSDVVSDRTIEPIRLIRGMRYIMGIERKTNEVRQYKIDRISGVEKMKIKVSNPLDFSEWRIDDFLMNGHKGVNVSLGLTNKAASLLCEEYGVKQSALLEQTSKEFPLRYEAPVYGMEGVGRFVMGLIDQIKVYGPERLKSYIRKKYVSQHLD